MKDDKLLILLCEETGIHIGDGSMNIYSGVYSYTLACHHIDDKKFMDNIVKPMYKELFDVDVKLRPWSKGTYGFRIHSKNVVKFKNEILGLPLGPKHFIKIPSFVFLSDDYKKAFLRGFMATDGSITTFLQNKKTIYPRIELTNVSEILMNQVMIILKELGFKFSVWKVHENHLKWRTATRLSVNGYFMLKKWIAEVGFINPKHREKAEKLIENKIFLVF